MFVKVIVFISLFFIVYKKINSIYFIFVYIVSNIKKYDFYCI